MFSLFQIQLDLCLVAFTVFPIRPISAADDSALGDKRSDNFVPRVPLVEM